MATLVIQVAGPTPTCNTWILIWTGKFCGSVPTWLVGAALRSCCKAWQTRPTQARMQMGVNQTMHLCVANSRVGCVSVRFDAPLLHHAYHTASCAMWVAPTPTGRPHGDPQTGWGTDVGRQCYAAIIGLALLRALWRSQVRCTAHHAQCGLHAPAPFGVCAVSALLSALALPWFPPAPPSD